MADGVDTGVEIGVASHVSSTLRSVADPTEVDPGVPGPNGLSTPC